MTQPTGKHVSNPSVPKTASGSSGSTKKPSRANSQSVGPGRRLLWRALLALIVPLLLVVGLELGLRLTGYGYRTSFFRPLRIGREEYLVDNDKFGWRFFPPEISRSPSPARILAHKPQGTYRIFLFGESAALGDPEPAYGAGRYLQALLQERFPGTKFEVVPGAMTAINSHGVLPIARECAAYNSDLWIIYMGNNEMIGPFGASTIFGPQAPPLPYVRLVLALQKTRLGQLLASLGRSLTSAAGRHGSSWAGMQMFVNSQIGPLDPRKERVYQSFQRNLQDIVRAGRAAHVPMILCTVAVNLKDCPPFASLRTTNAAAAEAEAAFEQLNKQGIESQQRGEFAAAAQKFEEAARPDSHFAEVQFRWAQCLSSLTNLAAAQAHFEQARDDDALPFRADSRLNAIIRETARRLAGPDLALCDAASLMASNSPVGVPGEETFYEHVHFNFDGNYRLALALANVAEPFLTSARGGQTRKEWSTQNAVERDLGMSDWNRYDVFDNVRRRFLQPPFTGQPANAEKAHSWQLRLEELSRSLNATNAQSARLMYVHAIKRSPEDFRLHANYAAFLEETRDIPDALTQWKSVETLLPHCYLPCFQMGRLLARQDQSTAARTWLSRALAIRPDLSEGWYELGRIQGADGQFQAALQSFQRAQQLVPAEPRYRCEMAKALVKLKRSSEAIAQLEAARRLGPIPWEAHYLLGEQLALAGRVSEARPEFEQALKVNPSFAMAHLNLGVALLKEGQTEEARRHFEEALRLDPQNELARRALSQISRGGR